jgi:hypothetical protein
MGLRQCLPATVTEAHYCGSASRWWWKALLKCPKLPTLMIKSELGLASVEVLLGSESGSCELSIITGSLQATAPQRNY